MKSPAEGVVERLRDLGARESLVGESAVFRDAVRPVSAVARSDATVLITGETGTGKELAAHAIHYLSPRAAYPFCPVNCGSLPDSLLQDELFGHEAGAFTDARTRRAGLLHESRNGTLFLDEVDALTPRAQVALLRLLQDRTFRPLGSSRLEQVDVRFLAASNAPLDELVRAGTFRHDLYYRLSVITIRLPPLRDRRGDIPLLVARFLEKHTPAGGPVPQVDPDAMAALTAFDWPGNVRELESVIVRAVVLGEGRTIHREDLGLPSPAASPPEAVAEESRGRAERSYQALKAQAIADFERDYLARLMARHRGNVSQAARAAGKERRELGRLLKKHQIDRGAFSN